jgi:MFS family permease
VQQFVGEAQKGTYFGTYRLWTLMVALLAQALFGLISDRSRLRWGRRRPFIFTGTLLDLVFIVLVGFTAGLEGLNGFWIMFAAAILLQISSNIAQAAEQGVIPDLVSEEHRGRFSGVKAMFELPVPLILVSFTIGKMVSKGDLWGGLGVGMAVILLVMLLSMFIPEKRPQEAPAPLDWKPFLRLVMMTAVFTLIILGSGQAVQLISGLLNPDSSPVSLFLIMGLFGLLGMAIAVGVGVWLSVQVGIGEDAKRNPSFTWWVVNRLAFLVGATNLSTFAVYYLQGRLGYEREKAAAPAAFLMLFVGVFILLSALPSGWLADKFGKKRMVGLSGLIAAFGTLVAIAVPSLPAIYLGGIIIGIATGLFFASNWALGTVLVPKEEAGRYLGISNLAGAGAGAVGAYIGGPIGDYFTVNVPSVPGLGYMLLFAIYGLLFLLSVLALARIPENK